MRNYGSTPLCLNALPQSEALVRPNPHRLPLRLDRVQRFQIGDVVRVAHGGEASIGPVRVLAAAADGHPPAFAHCSGTSAKYLLAGHEGWVYDWMLEPAEETVTWADCVAGGIVATIVTAASLSLLWLAIKAAFFIFVIFKLSFA
jgi:hypothetical protein